MVLRLGGVYADLDTECRRPMSELILPKDTMVGGWENEFARPQDAEARHYVRNRQVRALPAPAAGLLQQAWAHHLRSTGTCFGTGAIMKGRGLYHARAAAGSTGGGMAHSPFLAIPRRA